MITCQFSVYPLRAEHIGQVLTEVLAELDALGCAYQVGTMSTEVHGHEEQIFIALRLAFARAARHGDVVLVATVSNAC